MTTPLIQPTQAQPVFEAYVARRRRLSDERRSITHKFEIEEHQGYITVGLYEDGAPGEIFLRMGRESGALSAIIDAFAMSVSLGLQYGVPLKTLVSKYAHMRFDPAGPTKNPNIPHASSIIDYIFRWMSLKFLTPEDRHALGVHSEPGIVEIAGLTDSTNDRQTSIV